MDAMPQDPPSAPFPPEHALTRRRAVLAGGLAGLPLLSAFAGPAWAQASRRPPRVVVSTDIGGTDPDDFQSLVHLLLYADSLELEGLISSPFGPGRLEHIHQVIDLYARDYPNLSTWSDRYPSPRALRAISKQGETEVAPHAGHRAPTDGSRWIVACARRPDPRPLHVLVWGGIEDLAQALHDAPDILPRLRVYFIGGPNKKWCVDAYQYIAANHPKLWIIEANATYRGWFTGGDQSGERDNTAFVARHVAGRGALGEFFTTQLAGTIKMGDTPSVGWVLGGHAEDPTHPGWGGRFVRAWSREPASFRRLTTSADRMEQFGVLQLALPAGAKGPAQPGAVLRVENQTLEGSVDGDGALRFRFSPKDAKTYAYRVEGGGPGFDGATGQITATRPAFDADRHPARRWPNWWTDDPAEAVAEGPHLGARTVSRWRAAFLEDFAQRIARCQTPSPP